MRRLKALLLKEFIQMMRDPSSFMIAIVLPLILLFIFGYGINLDSNSVKIGLVLEDHAPDTTSLTASFTHSRFLDVKVGYDRNEFEEDLIAGRLRGIVVIPRNFAVQTAKGMESAKLQVIADGSEPNTASFMQGYVKGVVNNWLLNRAQEQGVEMPGPRIDINSRFWYNPELKSRNFLIPGSIAIVMTLIGSLLTALVVAREWERGTMETIMATPVTTLEIILGKLIPYFLLGLASMVLCWSIGVFYYDVPFNGSFFVLMTVTSLFLLCALGQGLLISTLAKDQFIASQAAIVSAFLPAFMLSGFIFEISSMPLPVQALTYLFAARYFVTSLQTLFLVGNIWPLLLSCMAAMGVIGSLFYTIIARKTSSRIDG
jgi:ABC-2 type transport system permease protein